MKVDENYLGCAILAKYSCVGRFSPFGGRETTAGNMSVFTGWAGLSKGLEKNAREPITHLQVSLFIIIMNCQKIYSFAVNQIKNTQVS